MTTIAAARTETGATAIAADSAWTRNGVQFNAGRKLRQFGGLTVGFAGSGYPSNMMPDAEYPATMDGLQAFARDLRSHLVDAGHVGQDVDGTKCVAAAALVVGWNFGPYVVDHDGTLVEAHDGYAAIGSGSAIAVGALHATRRFGLRSVKLAIAAAIRHDPGSGGPSQVVHPEPWAPRLVVDRDDVRENVDEDQHAAPEGDAAQLGALGVAGQDVDEGADHGCDDGDTGLNHETS